MGALAKLGQWLANQSDVRTRVVTGSPGTGKSALLARLITLAATTDNGTAFVHH